MSEIIHTKYTKDDVIAQQLMQSSQLHTAEMTSKNQIFFEDINDSYTNNICTFQLQALSNSSHTVDIRNSRLVLPMLGHLVTTHDISREQARQSMILKSDMSCIHNIDIELSNHQTQEPINNLSMYKAFIDHSTGSVNKDEWNDGLKIYHKCTGDGWYYNVEGGLMQDKLSFNGETEATDGTGFITYNKGMRSNMNYIDSKKTPVIQASTMSRYGEPRLERVSATEWYYHHFVSIRLGDVSSFCEQLGLMVGPYFQLKIRLNQVTDYRVTVNAAGIITKSHNMANDSVPFFRGSTQSDLHQEYAWDGSMGTQNATNDFTYQLMLGKIGAKNHDMSRPRWIMSTYSLSEALESQLLSNPVRTLNYIELIHSQHMGLKDFFSINLASSARDIERLIIIPIISKKSNGTQTGGVKINGCNSITHALNTSPINVNNLKLSISGRPIYMEPLQYSYEHYLQQMYDVYGNKGKNGGISFKDFNNVYKYFVFDLSRVAVSDIGAKASYELSGTIDKGGLGNSLEYDFYVFFEQRRYINVDLSTSQVM